MKISKVCNDSINLDSKLYKVFMAPFDIHFKPSHLYNHKDNHPIHYIP